MYTGIRVRLVGMIICCVVVFACAGVTVQAAVYAPDVLVLTDPVIDNTIKEATIGGTVGLEGDWLVYFVYSDTDVSPHCLDRFSRGHTAVQAASTYAYGDTVTVKATGTVHNTSYRYRMCAINQQTGIEYYSSVGNFAVQAATQQASLYQSSFIDLSVMERLIQHIQRQLEAQL